MSPTSKQISMDLDILGNSGRSSVGSSTDEWHPSLRGSNATRVYREMSDNDPIVGGILYAIESLTRSVQWDAVPANTTPEALAQAVFLEQAIDDMSIAWQDVLSDILTMLVYGWSWFEIVYKVRGGLDEKNPAKRSAYDDGLLTWRKFAFRPQATLYEFTYGPQGGLLGMKQVTSTGGEAFMPIEKSLLFRTKSNGNNPQGRSMLRNAYRSWYFLKRIQEIEAIGIERDLAGLPVLQVPPQVLARGQTGTAATLRNELEELIQQIKRDEREGVLIPAELDAEGKPTGYKLELLSSGGKRSLDVAATIKRYESRIAMSALAEFIMLGTDRHGSFSLVESKTDLFAIALGTILDSIEEVFNRFAIPRLWQLNGVPVELWPKLRHGDIETPDITATVEAAVNLRSAGLLSEDGTLQPHFRRLIGAPSLKDPNVIQTDGDTEEDADT